jgi:hypothetical protein
MVHRWATPALGLVACVLIASTAASQATEQRADRSHRGGSLGPNQPNPFSGQTTIPFSIGDADCATGTQQHVVTLRIYNILSQIVSVAALVDNDSGDAAGAVPASRTLSNLPLACGAYVARWDGKHAPDGREAAPGVYVYQLVIDGHPAGMRKMLLKR